MYFPGVHVLLAPQFFDRSIPSRPCNFFSEVGNIVIDVENRETKDCGWRYGMVAEPFEGVQIGGLSTDPPFSNSSCLVEAVLKKFTGT